MRTIKIVGTKEERAAEAVRQAAGYLGKAAQAAYGLAFQAGHIPLQTDDGQHYMAIADSELKYVRSYSDQAYHLLAGVGKSSPISPTSTKATRTDLRKLIGDARLNLKTPLLEANFQLAEAKNNSSEQANLGSTIQAARSAWVRYQAFERAALDCLDAEEGAGKSGSQPQKANALALKQASPEQRDRNSLRTVMMAHRYGGGLRLAGLSPAHVESGRLIQRANYITNKGERGVAPFETQKYAYWFERFLVERHIPRGIGNAPVNPKLLPADKRLKRNSKTAPSLRESTRYLLDAAALARRLYQLIRRDRALQIQDPLYVSEIGRPITDLDDHAGEFRTALMEFADGSPQLAHFLQSKRHYLDVTASTFATFARAEGNPTYQTMLRAIAGKIKAALSVLPLKAIPIKGTMIKLLPAEANALQAGKQLTFVKYRDFYSVISTIAGRDVQHFSKAQANQALAFISKYQAKGFKVIDTDAYNRLRKLTGNKAVTSVAKSIHRTKIVRVGLNPGGGPYTGGRIVNISVSAYWHLSSGLETQSAQEAVRRAQQLLAMGYQFDSASSKQAFGRARNQIVGKASVTAEQYAAEGRRLNPGANVAQLLSQLRNWQPVRLKTRAGTVRIVPKDFFRDTPGITSKHRIYVVYGGGARRAILQEGQIEDYVRTLIGQ